MKKIKELEYLDIKRSIENSKEEIERCQKIIGITRIVLNAFETEIRKYPPPPKPKGKENTTPNRSIG